MIQCNRVLRDWPADRLLWFTGHEPKRDAPYPYALTFFLDGDDKTYKGKFPGFCLCFKEALHRTQWLNAVLALNEGPVCPQLIHI